MRLLEAAGQVPLDYLRQYLPTETPHFRVTDIPIKQWVDEGVKVLVADVEGTFGETGSEELHPEYVQWLYDAREEGITGIALSTNFDPDLKTEKDVAKLASWGTQTEADLVLSAFEGRRRKPGPYHIMQAKNHFGVNPNQIGVLGDKASADVRAGRLGGAEHIAWTRPIPGGQAAGDLYVRGPVEAGLRVRAHLALNPVIQEAAGLDPKEAELLAQQSLGTIGQVLENSLPEGIERVVGVPGGMEDIELTDDDLAMLQQPVYREALDRIQNITKALQDLPPEQIKESVKEFMRKYGGQIADGLSWERLGAAAAILAIQLFEDKMDPQTKQRLEKGIYIVSEVGDIADGPLARYSDRGPTARGASIDQDFDKALSGVADLFVLMSKGNVHWANAITVILRDASTTIIRKPFKDRGYDTSSEKWGKRAMLAKVGAQTFGLLWGNKFPKTNMALQTTATGLKVASSLHAPMVWIERKEVKEHIENNSRRLDLAA